MDDGDAIVGFVDWQLPEVGTELRSQIGSQFDEAPGRQPVEQLGDVEGTFAQSDGDLFDGPSLVDLAKHEPFGPREKVTEAWSTSANTGTR